MQQRITDSDDLTIAENLLAQGQEVVVQFSEDGYSVDTLRGLNELAIKYGNSLQIRFFGFYSSSFDFRTLLAVKDVRNLAVDCLLNASNFETLGELSSLSRLSVGVYNSLPENLLSYASLNNLESLSVTESKQRKLDLSHLSRFELLRELCVVGHTKSIASIGSVSGLTELRLSQIGSGQKIDFINSLSMLKKLTVILGGRDNLNEVMSPSIEELQVLRVRGISEIEPTNFPRLKSLLVEDQIRLQSMEFTSGNQDLKKVVLGNCKDLASVRGLAELPSLDTFRVYQTSLDLDALLSQGLPPSLRNFAFYTKSQKKNSAIQGKLAALGYNAT
jgi:protein phosphatase 1 regulatory subunit 7